MKRIILLTVTLSLFLLLCGCGQSSTPELIQPTAFYYHNDLDAKDDFEHVFVAEFHEGAFYQEDYIALLNSYFSGPASGSLINPFPTGLEAISITMEDSTTYVILSDQICKINNLDLTMACSCLSLTLFELTQCTSVQISAENNLIADQEVIIIEKDALLFSDNTLLPSGN